MNTINNLKEFEEAIKDIKNKNNGNDFFFRGQANDEWDITSSAFRFIKNKYPTLDITPNILNEFEQEIPEFYTQYYKRPEIDVHYNQTELLCMLQHLGGKTPIIDISSQPSIALFFACEQFINEKNGVVFVFPKNSQSEILNKSQQSIGKLIGEAKLNKDNPACRRYIAQDSHFFKPLSDDCKIKNNDEVFKIIINKDAKHLILDELNEKGINYEKVYPDIFEFIKRQAQYNKCEKVFFSDIIRSIAQTIYDGNIIRTTAAIQTLDDLMSKNSWSEEELIKMKYLKIEGLLCMQKYDEALNLLSLMPNDFYTLQSYHKTDAHSSKDFDPTHIQFIPEFEKAKCYMGKKEYELAETCYAKASEIIHNITENYTYNDFWKGYAKSLVLWDKNNLIIAQDILLKCKGDSLNQEPDRGELYMLSEEWEKAIEILKKFVDQPNRNKDYAYSLLGNCYMALSQKGNKELYIQQAIKYYKMAIPDLKQNDNNSYVSETQYHDQYYKLAIAYQELNNIEKAKEYYKIIISYPFENEDAMHDLAYMLYKKGVNQTEEAMTRFFYAIEHSRAKKNPRNFNDLGKLLLDLYQGKRDFPNDSKHFMSLLKTSFINLGKRTEFHEGVQVELRTVTDLISKKVSDKQLILSITESCFKIAKLLNITDAFANKNLGDIYYEEFQSSTDPLTKHEVGLLALNSYNLANCFYSIDQQTDIVIKNRINELEKVLSINYTRINGYE